MSSAFRLSFRLILPTHLVLFRLYPRMCHFAILSLLYIPFSSSSPLLRPDALFQLP
jgi:hypothetical protein